MIQRCEFFTYDVINENCMLFDYDIEEYILSCKSIAGPSRPSLKTCRDTESKCKVRITQNFL